MRFTFFTDCYFNFAIPRSFHELFSSDATLFVVEIAQTIPLVLLFGSEGTRVCQPGKNIVLKCLLVAFIPAPIEILTTQRTGSSTAVPYFFEYHLPSVAIDTTGIADMR